MPKQRTKANKVELDSQEELVDKKLAESLDRFKQLRNNEVFPLFLNRAEIREHAVDDIFDELRKRYKLGSASQGSRLDVILASGGGSIDSAYNIGLLLRRYATEELNIIITLNDFSLQGCSKTITRSPRKLQPNWLTITQLTLSVLTAMRPRLLVYGQPYCLMIRSTLYGRYAN